MSLVISSPPPHILLPSWYQEAFAHLDPADREEVERLWCEEPALRTLILLLDTVHPSNIKNRSCHWCGNTQLQWRKNGEMSWVADCRSCQKMLFSSLGTPFHRLQKRNYLNLYRVAVVLWGPWTPWYAWRIANLKECDALRPLQTRLAPLLEELGDTELVSRPRYRLGFTPVQQGIHCLRCGGSQIVYRKRFNPDNPIFHCTDCLYHFQLQASRRHLLPLPEGVCCPECNSRELIRRTVDAEGRGYYRCAACLRVFVERPKKPQPPTRKRPVITQKSEP